MTTSTGSLAGGATIPPPIQIFFSIRGGESLLPIKTPPSSIKTQSLHDLQALRTLFSRILPLIFFASFLILPLVAHASEDEAGDQPVARRTRGQIYSENNVAVVVMPAPLFRKLFRNEDLNLISVNFLEYMASKNPEMVQKKDNEWFFGKYKVTITIVAGAIVYFYTGPVLGWLIDWVYMQFVSAPFFQSGVGWVLKTWVLDPGEYNLRNWLSRLATEPSSEIRALLTAVAVPVCYAGLWGLQKSWDATKYVCMSGFGCCMRMGHARFGVNKKKHKKK